MMQVAMRGRAWTSWCIALLMHAGLLAILLRDKPLAADERSISVAQLVFIQPPSAPIKPAPSAPPSSPSIPPLTRRLPAPNDTIAPPGSAPAAADTPVADPFAAAPRLSVEALIKQAGAADREVRPKGENDDYGPVPDSMRSVLSRAFTQAKLAVPLKWYEAARIELFSAPNDPKKIYQVKTAFGTYCLSYPDPREIDGRAQASQPRIGSCPARF